MESVKTFIFQNESFGEELKVYINELVDPEYGMFTWPSAPVLGQFILKHEHECHGKNVLELGAGTALPGIVAAKCGANVILSDSSKFPKCQENALKSCISNNVESRIIQVPLTWGEFTPELLDLPKLDVILGSDCFYNPNDFEDIIVTIAFLMEKNPNCVFWCTYQVRSSNWTIENILKKWKLKCTHINLSSFGGDQENLGGHEISQKHAIQMLEIKMF
ncbi:histone-arginine methyltransferase METTL23-like isoform X1 [Rhopilema esculentum]|uniref:histone-arginine methyltransferase METTL23-like isoform X1 n=2 Tax=Rhopilema esculentum TaxID=499914 RepID=UPI0031D5CAA0